ncbi:conserved hypothetical protein [Gammaproteobacteria bacterium]
MDTQKPVPNWLLKELASGAQTLIVCCLPGAPSAETMTATVKTWASIFLQTRTWSETRDIPRLKQAFTRLAANCERWPTPKQILESIPPPFASPWKVLPKPEYPLEKAKENLAKIREMLAKGRLTNFLSGTKPPRF